jgi:hypothetical protein
MNMSIIADLKNLEHHFSARAEQGWMIDKIGIFTHRYRAVEPCKKRFFVDLLPQITMFDYPENEDAQDYRAICEASGWTFVTANKQFHVFCADHDAPAPVPIHTDNRIQARIYLKACRKYELPYFFIALIMLSLLSPLTRGTDVFLSNMMLFLMIGYLLFLIGYVWTFGFMIRWYARMRASVKKGLPMPAVGRRSAAYRNTCFLAGIIAFFVCWIMGVSLEIAHGMSAAILPIILMPFSGLAVGLWVRRQIDTNRRGRKENMILFIAAAVVLEVVVLGTLVFAAHRLIASPFRSDSLDGRPALTLRDAGVTAPPDSTYTRVKGTIAVPVNYEYWEYHQQGNTVTEVTRSVSASLTRSLYHRAARDFTRKFSAPPGWAKQITDLEGDEAAFWGAEEGMAFFFDGSEAIDLLLLNGKTILRLSFYSKNMNMESAVQAVRGLWNELGGQS